MDEQLFVASAGGDQSSIKSCIEKGANVNAVSATRSSKTPLHLVMEKGNIDAVRLLLDADANIEAIDGWGNNPLYCAAFYGRSDIAKLLLERGANRNNRSHGDNCTPADVAAKHGFAALANLINNFGKDDPSPPRSAGADQPQKKLVVLSVKYPINEKFKALIAYGQQNGYEFFLGREADNGLFWAEEWLKKSLAAEEVWLLVSDGYMSSEACLSELNFVKTELKPNGKIIKLFKDSVLSNADERRSMVMHLGIMQQTEISSADPVFIASIFRKSIGNQQPPEEAKPQPPEEAKPQPFELQPNVEITAPSNGSVKVTVSLKGTSGHWHIDGMVNGTRQGYVMMLHPRHVRPQDRGAVTAGAFTLKVNKGDKVRIYCHANAGDVLDQQVNYAALFSPDT